MYFSVDPKVFQTLPNAVFAVVIVRGIDNTKPQPEIQQLLEKNIQLGEAYFAGKNLKETPEIAPYREAFRTLGINPNKFKCSIEALLTRIAKQKGLPAINPAVDLGNAVSIKHFLPIGAHDLATITAGLEVRFSQPEDTFILFGGTTAETPDPDELLYVADHQIRTRRWTWRQSEVGKMTEQTTDILYPIDAFAGINDEKALAAANDLVTYLQQYFDCDAQIGLVDQKNPRFDF